MGRQQPLHHRVCLPVLHLLSRLGSMPVTLHTLRGLLQQTPGTPGKLGSRHSSKLPMLPGTWSVGLCVGLLIWFSFLGFNRCPVQVRWTQTLGCLPHGERIFGLRPCGWLTETERATSLQKALAVRPGKLPPLRSLKCLPPRTRRFLLGSLRMTLLASLDLSQQTPGTAGKLGSRHSNRR